MKLRAIAHARTGDKGDVSNIAVFAHRAEDYPRLAASLTAERVRAHLSDVVRGTVRRYELPRLGALNFVLEGALGGGVTRSLALDPHGKSLSSSLLDMDIADDIASPGPEGPPGRHDEDGSAPGIAPNGAPPSTLR